MADGVAAHALLPEPAPTDGDSDIEQHIGEVLVALAAVGMQAHFEVQADRHMHPDTKARGGALVAELINAQTKLNGTFVDVVRRIGQHRYRDAGLSEAAIERT